MIAGEGIIPSSSFTPQVFTKTPRQIEACSILNQNEHSMLYGGSRSGKTTIIIRNIILRALMFPSRHLVARFRFNHAKISLWYDTIPKVLKMCFPGVRWTENKSDWFITLHLGGDRTSEIWLGGVDDKDRVEKILGNEYSTIYLNECSQIKYDAVTMLHTRLAENSGLELKFYYDCNPPGKKHWTHQMFIEGLVPGTFDTNSYNSDYLLVNPKHNIVNLPPAYIKILESLPKRQRQRFLDGLYLTDVEGALWTDAQLSEAKAKPKTIVVKTVIAVDPAVSHSDTSDECGIVPCSIDENGDGVVHDDWSVKASTLTWAQRVVNCYYDFNANYVVAETNQGGDLVVDAIKNIDSTIKVVKVHASKGKFARAEPVQQLYEQGKIRHEKECPLLEAEMTEWVPEDTKGSPNRIDALVWGLTNLMIKKQTRIHVG